MPATLAAGVFCGAWPIAESTGKRTAQVAVIALSRCCIVITGSYGDLLGSFSFVVTERIVTGPINPESFSVSTAPRPRIGGTVAESTFLSGDAERSPIIRLVH